MGSENISTEQIKSKHCNVEQRILRIISEPRRQRNNVRKVHGMMEDNEMRTAIETREYDNGGVVDMQDNGDGRQGHR